jgi:hypothetical protein
MLSLMSTPYLRRGVSVPPFALLAPLPPFPAHPALGLPFPHHPLPQTQEVVSVGGTLHFVCQSPTVATEGARRRWWMVDGGV